MPVQDNDDKRTNDQPAADAEEELRRKQAQAQEHEHENNIHKEGKDEDENVHQFLIITHSYLDFTNRPLESLGCLGWIFSSSFCSASSLKS